MKIRGQRESKNVIDIRDLVGTQDEKDELIRQIMEQIHAQQTPVYEPDPFMEDLGLTDPAPKEWIDRRGSWYDGTGMRTDPKPPWMWWDMPTGKAIK